MASRGLTRAAVSAVTGTSLISKYAIWADRGGSSSAPPPPRYREVPNSSGFMTPNGRDLTNPTGASHREQY